MTTEANPDSVDEADLVALAGGGFTRVSFGMQSAVPHVLKVLERTHEPARVPRVVDWARRAGLSTSLDLIYGAPGESLEDWQRSLDAVTRIGPDHVSAYALVIEEGTRMWGQVRRGELPMPEDDDEATKYEMADAALRRAGYEWYEISNWARPGAECRHNQAYWLDWDWWGAGPGAHSHLGDVRLWNTKHPVAWAGQISTGHLPVAGHEVIDAGSRELERIMLGIRLREGIALASLGVLVRRRRGHTAAPGARRGRSRGRWAARRRRGHEGPSSPHPARPPHGRHRHPRPDPVSRRLPIQRPGRLSDVGSTLKGIPVVRLRWWLARAVCH